VQHCQMLQAGDLVAIVGDDSRDGFAGPQYSGIWSLASKHRVFNVFGNSFAGLLPGAIRGCGCRLEPIDDTRCALVCSADERSQSDVRAEYALSAPNYIDHTLSITDHADVRGPAAFREVASCCYMNSPEDSHLNFLSDGEWRRYISPKHGVGSNIAPTYYGDGVETFPDEPSGDLRPFHWDRTEFTFDEPFYYGRLGDMLFLLVFDTPRWLRFFCSPTGGGASLIPGKSCPAWDYEWIIPESEYEVGREYTFRLRLVYKPFVSDGDVLTEVRRAQVDLGFETVG
jgi:hypothetical protein